jgi:hypothetical protein
MLKKLSFTALIVAAVAGMYSCTTCQTQKNDKEDLTISPDSLKGDKPLALSKELIGDVVQNISSPVEMAALIKKSGVEFSQKVLNSTDKVSDYNTSYSRALNLGVYSADLGYINMFDKNNIVVSYLMAVKELAEGIKVGQFFDFTALKRLATNSNNLDSLMQISVSSMNKMDNYLRDQDRSNVSSLIIAGAWIEGLYIAGNVVEQTNNKELIDRIAEQKDIVDILLIIISNYNKDENFAKLAAELEKLKVSYDGVKITTEVGEPTKKEINGSLVIIQNEISHIEASPETIKNIIKEIKSLRQFVITQ